MSNEQSDSRVTTHNRETDIIIPNGMFLEDGKPGFIREVRKVHQHSVVTDSNNSRGEHTIKESGMLCYYSAPLILGRDFSEHVRIISDTPTAKLHEIMVLCSTKGTRFKVCWKTLHPIIPDAQHEIRTYPYDHARHFDFGMLVEIFGGDILVVTTDHRIRLWTERENVI